VATVANIKPSITQLSAEEVFKLIKETRFQRRQVPEKKIRARSGAKAKRRPVSLKAKVATLTAEQRIQLLKDLGG
jgi:hypothetical protein